MGPILNLMDLANALARTLEDSSCFREETLPCRVASPPNSLWQSTTGGTVMPTTARVLPGLNMLHCAHAPASSLHFVDGQELLSALLNSSPLFHLASRLHGLTSYFTGCPCVLYVLLFGGLFFVVGVVCCWVSSCWLQPGL